MKKIAKIPPVNKKQLVPFSAGDQQWGSRGGNPQAAKQSAMLRDMKEKFANIEKQLKKDPNFDISDKDIELLRSYVVASIFVPMQSIKLLKEQAKEREAAEEYERELEKIIERAEKVDKTTKEYTEEQKKTITLIDDKDTQLKESAKIYEKEVQREEEEKKKIADINKEIDKVQAEISALEKKKKIVSRGIRKMTPIKEFLEEVAKSREEFDSKIDYVKNRFETLQAGTIELDINSKSLEAKLEQEKENCIRKLADLDKEILIEQNKRPAIRKSIDEHENKIASLTDKEKHGNEKLIKKHKKWTQIRLAIDHLADFMEKFSVVTATEDPKGMKGAATKFQTTQQKQEEKKKDGMMDANKEIEELKNQVNKLKKIQKSAAYWKKLYEGDYNAFKKDYLYEEIKKKEKTSGKQTQSPTKKLEAATNPTGKDVTTSGVTYTTKKLTKIINSHQ